jgi:hypothetical protein
MDKSTSKMKKLNDIKNTYNQFRISLLEKGKLPMRATNAGFWGTSIIDEIYSLFSRIQLSRYPNFIDLGSGDGRVTLTASLFTDATGIELDLPLYNKSLEISERLGLDAEFIHKDYMEHDISKYSILFNYPDKPFYFGLRDKLKKELKGKLLLYGRIIDDHWLKRLSSFRVNGTLVGIYSK